jgi:uncharacterized protein YeaO (DUF488 family)
VANRAGIEKDHRYGGTSDCPGNGTCHVAEGKGDTSEAKLSLKRIYDDPSPDDGYRVLVDRIWPRGVSTEDAALGAWIKEIAPTAELRKWFGHDPKQFAEFRERARAELDDNPAIETMRAAIAAHKHVTLLYGAHDRGHNQAVVLKEYLENS